MASNSQTLPEPSRVSKRWPLIVPPLQIAPRAALRRLGTCVSLTVNKAA